MVRSRVASRSNGRTGDLGVASGEFGLVHRWAGLTLGRVRGRGCVLAPCPAVRARSAAHAEAVVWAVAGDRAVCERDGEGCEEAAAVDGDAWAGRQRVAGDRGLGQVELRVRRRWEEHVVPDAAAQGLSLGSVCGSRVVADGCAVHGEQPVAVVNAGTAYGR